MLKFKIGDPIKITSGKDKGREGKIEKVFPKTFRAVIPGINEYKKHVKGTQGQKGGIYSIPRPLSFSNFALVCPKCNKVTRVGIRIVGDEKVRICLKCGKEISIKQK